MIKLITGKPGAGKTFFMVKSLVDTFYDWSEEERSFVFKKDKDGKPIEILLISNIPDLTLDHVILDEALDKRVQQVAKHNLFTGGADYNDSDLLEAEIQKLQTRRVSLFFNFGFQDELYKKKGKIPIVYAISECQKIFGKAHLGQKKKEENPQDVFNFWEEHRHLGVTAFFDTQNRKKLHDEILTLVEAEIDARPRSVGVGGKFKYHDYVDGVKQTTVPHMVSPDQKIFDVYRSQMANEIIKPKSIFKKLLIMIFCLVLFLFVFTYYFKTHIFGGGSLNQTKTAQTQRQGSQAHAAQGGQRQKRSKQSDKPVCWYPVSHSIWGGNLWIYDPRINEILPVEYLDRTIKRKHTRYYMALKDGDKAMIDAVEAAITARDKHVTVQEDKGFNLMGSDDSDS